MRASSTSRSPRLQHSSDAHGSGISPLCAREKWARAPLKQGAI